MAKAREQEEGQGQPPQVRTIRNSGHRMSKITKAMARIRQGVRQHGLEQLPLVIGHQSVG